MQSDGWSRSSGPSQSGNANSLPPTDFSDDGVASRLNLPRPTRGFANAHVASNPQASDETLAAALARVVARPQVAIASVMHKIVDGKTSDPTAKALGYVNDSAKPDQKCANCALYQGQTTDPRGGRSIFAGKSVAAGGWCSGWAKKP